MIRFFRRAAPRDQAYRLRDLVRDAAIEPPSPEPTGYAGPPIVLLVGAKGGVGTTTLAAHLAKALAAKGRHTVAVDADLRQAHLARALEAPSGGEFTVADVMNDRASADEAIVAAGRRLRVLPGAWGDTDHESHQPVGAENLLRSLSALAGATDAVVIDGGSCYRAAAAPLWRAARAALVVTDPEPNSLLGAYTAIKLARAGADGHDELPEARLLVNRVFDNETADRLHAGIGSTCQRYLGSGAPLAGWFGEGELEPAARLLAARLVKELRVKREDEAPTALAAA